MEHKWYIVHAYSNFEKNVADAIRQAAAEKGMSELIEEVFVPTEDVTEVRRGRKITAERRYLPGYVLVKMLLNDPVPHRRSGARALSPVRRQPAHYSLLQQVLRAGRRHLPGQETFIALVVESFTRASEPSEGRASAA